MPWHPKSVLCRIVSLVLDLYRRGRAEPVILLAFIALVAALWTLAGVVEEVLEGDTAALDRHVLMLFRSGGDPADPVGAPWVEEIMRDITALGGIAVLTLATLACIGGLLLAGSRARALYLGLAVGATTLLANLLKAGFGRERPDFAVHGSYVFTDSFPSGHSMMSAMVFLTLGALMARAAPGLRLRGYILGCAAFLSVLVGVSRLYLGVHWPTDVAAGWMSGAACALFFWLLAQYLRRAKGWDI